MRPEGTRAFLRRHRVTVASWTALATMSGALVAYAVTADGYPVHKAELNDGGVWITNQSMGALGRQNVPVAQIDAHIFSSGVMTEDAGLDVLQDDAAVVSVDRDAQQLTPIDVSLAAGQEAEAVTAGGDTTLFGGGSIGSLDEETGKLWATRYDPATGVGGLADLDNEAKPLVTVGANPVGTSSRSGVLYAASADGGELVALRPAAGGAGFEKPEKSALPSTGQLAGLTAVGDTPVALDDEGALVSGGEVLTRVEGSAPRLQQAGPAHDEVLVATSESLVAVAVDGGESRTLAQASGEAAAPVRATGGCAFAAWHDGTNGTIASACGSGEAVVNTFEVKADAELVFRVNRNQVILNDEVNGTAWIVEGATATQISNWEAFQPQEQKKDDKDDRETEAETTTPPQAENDKLGARPGRTTVLNVLDNDKVADGKILSVVDVKQPTREGVEVRIAPDRQTLLATAAPGVSGRYSFKYTIDDGTKGKNAQDDGEVALDVRTDNGSAKPTLRPNPPKRTYAIAAGAVLEVAAHPDWRDTQYGDPVGVTDVKAAGDLKATTTAAGLIRLEAPPRIKGGTRAVTYTVATGEDSRAEGTLQVKVLASGVDTVAPTAEPDVASGEVGTPIKIKPLDNDVAGADAADPGARLVIAGKVAPTGGLDVDTDLESGVVTVTGDKPGTYLLTYSAGFGAADRDGSEIRVDIEPSSKESDRPVATPDTANVHGMSPMVVDVLANDYDPKGRMLVVQNARPSSETSQLEVAVIDGRWIRVNATDPHITPQSQSVTYTISNGVSTASGSISVTQREALTGVANAPITQVDRVTVRAGDTALVPVLDNDSTPSGDPVGLVLDPTTEVRGELDVLPVQGKAYVAGRQVRFVAPEELEGAADVDVRYVVENTGDPTAPTATGVVKVHITAQPSPTNPNQAPTPRALEGRVVQGDVVTLKLPAIGSDPDGDSVAVSGIQTPPELGRVIAWGANSLTYQAYPDVQGTDEFRYTVTDRYGASASGSVRVGVVPPGAPQDPLAIDDSLVAAPGRTVDVDVLANDMRTPGTKLTILPLEGAPEGVELRSDTGPVRIIAPDDKKTTRVVYTITNGLAESRGVVTVKGSDDFNNPPVVGDIYATPKPDATSVEVDVLGKAYDLDGPEDALEIEDVVGDDLDPGETGESGAGGGAAVGEDEGPATVEIKGGKVVVPITDVAQVLAYRVVDGDGAAAAAAIYVPAKPKDTPYLKPGAEITLDPDSKTTVQLEELVVDPEGDPVRLTTDDTISASPSTRLSVEAADEKSLRVTATDSEGPGAVTFEVVDRDDLEDREGHRAFISVPVQVGDPTPVVTCPDEPIQVPEGSVSRTVDIASICHVWTSDPAKARDLEFTAEWVEGQSVDDVEVGSVDGGGIQLVAGNGAKRGATGALAIAAEGYEATGTLLVEVVKLPPPSLAPIKLDTQADKPVTVDVAQYLTSPLPSDTRDVEIVAVTPQSGASATPKFDGSKLTLIPKADTDGVMNYRLEVSDAGGNAVRPTAVGQVQLAVVARPDAPTNLTTGKELLSNTVALTWTTPDNNGERIDRYEVDYGGGTFSCPGSPCRVTGLDNGKAYNFRVRAHNAVDWSDWSNGARGEADAFTGPVRNPRILLQRDNSIRVAWDAPADCDCSAVQKYRVSAPGIGNVMLDASRTQYDVRAANGEKTTVTIVPLNKKGLQENTGPTNSVTGMGAGAPSAPSAPTVSATDVAGGSQSSVNVSWPAVGPNGPGPTSYEVSRDGKVVCAWQTGTSCSDAGITNDGSFHTYTVRAKNAEADSDREAAAGGADKHISPESGSTRMEASAPPEKPVIVSLTPTGQDGQATIAYQVGASHGAVNKVTCRLSNGNACGGWTSDFPRGGASGSKVISGFTDGSAVSATLTACNGSKSDPCSPSASKSATTYGPIGAISIDGSTSSRTINWNIRIDPNGKPVNWEVRRDGANGMLVASGTTGTGVFTRSGSDGPRSYDTGYTYALLVRDSDGVRNQKNAWHNFRTDPAPNPTITASKGDSCSGSNCVGPMIACSSTCWYVVANASNWVGSSTCGVYNGSPSNPGSQIRSSWIQRNGSQQTSVWIGSNVPFHIRCVNGSNSPGYTW